MLENNSWLPLFPLHTALFPEGVLSLRVFEARYTDMVRECMKKDAPFGVVQIRTGQEVGPAAEPEAVGCLAHIRHWDMAELGVLLLRVEGGTRFQIIETRILDDQRLEARVAPIAADAPVGITETHLRCATALKAVIARINERNARPDEGLPSLFPEPLRLDDAAWVGNRWSEILPIPAKARQKLLELTDAASRLAIIDQYLQQHQIL